MLIIEKFQVLALNHKDLNTILWEMICHFRKFSYFNKFGWHLVLEIFLSSKALFKALNSRSPRNKFNLPLVKFHLWICLKWWQWIHSLEHFVSKVSWFIAAIFLSHLWLLNVHGSCYFTSLRKYLLSIWSTNHCEF